LLEKNVSIDIMNNDKFTALHIAVTKKNERVVKLLLDKNANQGTFANQNAETPLHTAVEKKALDIVKLLVEDQKNKGTFLIDEKKGMESIDPPLTLAVKLGFLDISKYLIDNQYNNWHGNDKKETVYTMVAAGHKAVLELLIEKDKLNLSETNYSESCLRKAVAKCNRQAVNNIFSLIDIWKPTEQDKEETLRFAEEKLQSLDDHEQKESIQQIIDKLNKETTIHRFQQLSEEQIQHKKKLQLKIKEKKKQFNTYFTNLKKKTYEDFRKEATGIAQQIQELDKELVDLKTEYENA